MYLPLGGMGCGQAWEEMVSLLRGKAKWLLKEGFVSDWPWAVPTDCLRLGASFPHGENCLSSV